MNVVLAICVALLAVSALLLVVRISLGPTMLDRAVALDVLVAVLICGLALEAAIHQLGCWAVSAAPARLAASSVANRAKQVAPLPVSLAIRAPGSASSASSASLISGTRRAAGSPRSLPRGSK